MLKICDRRHFMLILFVFLITYFIASINPSIIVCKFKTNTDIRNSGSGNAGTTNAMRVLGKKIGILVFILDISKVLIAYLVIYLLAKCFSYADFITLNGVFTIAAVVGHCYPVYYSFKGGKGVVVMLICAIILNYKVALICLAFALILMVLTKMVSAGSLGGLMLFDVMIFLIVPKVFFYVIVVSFIIVFKHRENIKRILNNQENKLF